MLRVGLMLCLHAVSFPGQCGFLRHQEDVLQTNMKIDDREASVRGTRRHMPLWACKLRTACSRRRGPTSPRRRVTRGAASPRQDYFAKRHYSNLGAGESFPHANQRLFAEARVGMCGAEDPFSSSDHVFEDGHGFYELGTGSIIDL